MAKLVLGTNKQTVVPAVVRDVSPEIYRVFRNNNGKLENSITTPFMPLPSTITDVDNFVLYRCYRNTPADVLSGAVDLSSLITLSGESSCGYMFYSCPGVTSADLSSLKTIPGTNACQQMFAYSNGIRSADLSSLTTISGFNTCASMFNRCISLTSVDLSSLTTISGMQATQGIFQSCTSLTSVDLSSLTTISGSNACWGMFADSTSLRSCKMNKLSVMSVQIAPSYGGIFNGCTKLESVELGGLKASTFASKKDQIAYLFNSYTGSQAPNGCTVHFPSNFDPSDPNHTFDASTLTGYPTFGGNANYIHVAFDLPATES